VNSIRKKRENSSYRKMRESLQINNINNNQRLKTPIKNGAKSQINMNISNKTIKDYNDLKNLNLSNDQNQETVGFIFDENSSKRRINSKRSIKSFQIVKDDDNLVEIDVIGKNGIKFYSKLEETKNKFSNSLNSKANYVPKNKKSNRKFFESFKI